MTEPSLDIQAAQDAVLREDVTLIGLVGKRIYDSVPEDPVFPYIVIGDDQTIDDSNQCSDVWRVVSRVHVYTRSVGNMEIKTITGRVQTLLKAPLTLENFNISSHFMNDTVYLREEGTQRHSVTVFENILSPTGAG